MQPPYPGPQSASRNGTHFQHADPSLSYPATRHSSGYAQNYDPSPSSTHSLSYGSQQRQDALAGRYTQHRCSSLSNCKSLIKELTELLQTHMNEQAFLHPLLSPTTRECLKYRHDLLTGKIHPPIASLQTFLPVQSLHTRVMEDFHAQLQTMSLDTSYNRG